MLVKLTVHRAGRRQHYQPGDKLDLPDDEARRLIDAGQAIPVRAPAPVETTSARPAAETASRRRAPTTAPRRRAAPRKTTS